MSAEPDAVQREAVRRALMFLLAAEEQWWRAAKARHALIQAKCAANEDAARELAEGAIAARVLMGITSAAIALHGTIETLQ